MITITNSILAGALVGIGDVVLMSCDNRYIGALLFAVALVSIIYFDLPLYTGRVGAMIHLKTYLYCFFVLFFNTIGAALAVWTYKFNAPENAEKIASVAAQKFSRGYIALFVAGILCNVLIHLAVSSRHSVLVILCVMTFIVCGFEHSIADAGYVFCSWKYVLPWLIVVAGNTIGGLLTFYLLHEDEIDADESAEQIESIQPMKGLLK